MTAIMHTRLARIVSLGLTLILGIGSSAARAGAPGSAGPRVLFVGNSYTYFNDLPEMLAALAASGGHPIETRMIAPGGWCLKDHYGRGEAPGVVANERWDFVVLQEQSALGATVFVDGQLRVGTDEYFRPWAEKWATDVSARGARPVFYLTWAHKDSPEDQTFLTAAVRSVAHATHSELAPVGPAWALARERRPALELYVADGSHPSPAGSYLAACTLYATVLRASPVGLPGRVSGTPVDLDTEQPKRGETAVLVDLADEDARFLQETAWSVWQSWDRERDVAVPPPKPLDLPPLPEGEVPTEAALAGSWSGSLAFLPSGPATLTLMLDPPGSPGAAWSGLAEIAFHSSAVPDVSVDVQVTLAGTELTFAVPLACFECDIRFSAVLRHGELIGRAEARGAGVQEGLRFLSSWTLHRQE